MTWAPQQTQKSIYETLIGDVTLMALVSGVFDFAPDNQAYPYITIKQRGFNERGNHTSDGWQSDYQIDVWYRAPGRGRLKVQDIQARIDFLLNKQSICIDGWNTLLFLRTFVDIIEEPDNVTLHGVQIFNILLGEA